jgi:trehalose-6-phosphate synthase
MNEEEKKGIELLENIRNNSWTTKYIMSSDSKNAEVLLNLIDKLQKENEELKEEVISVQKVKDKIEEYKKMLLSCNRFSDVDRIKAINERILELQELLEGRK